MLLVTVLKLDKRIGSKARAQKWGNPRLLYNIVYIIKTLLHLLEIMGFLQV